jgi:hypothetical protein
MAMVMEKQALQEARHARIKVTAPDLPVQPANSSIQSMLW